MSELQVYFEHRVVGTIVVNDDSTHFDYQGDWLSTLGAFPVSTSMPLAMGRIPADVFLPWAANLLPESENLQAVSRLLGVASNDVVSILARMGQDTAGALSIGRPAGTSSEGWRLVETPADLERIINQLPAKPFLVGAEGVSMSLAGAQTKIGVALDDEGRIHIPTEGSPSTHILKPEA